MKSLTVPRVRQLLAAARQTRILVLGDVMLDQFIWGRVARISPEAPVPVVELERESFMPGGAANVARNLADLAVPTDLFGVVGQDDAARNLKELLVQQKIGCSGLLSIANRMTSIKTRIVAHQQQVVRVDRETRSDLDEKISRLLVSVLKKELDSTAALILGDYGKGVITQPLLDEIKCLCRERGIWLSFDPKPVHLLQLNGLSLITPNRKEAFELANMEDNTRAENPMKDKNLLRVAEKLLHNLAPAVLLITISVESFSVIHRAAPSPCRLYRRQFPPRDLKRWRLRVATRLPQSPG